MFSTSRHINQRYTIIEDRVLGKGSTGYVFLGFETANPNHKVAIKAIDLKQIDNQVTKYLLSCQITALSQLSKIQHSGRQHIVRLIEVASYEEHIYLITELLEGGTLAEYIKRHPNGLSGSEALVIFRQIIKGYQHIRNKNIIHRDLKPDNILFKAKPQLRKDIAIIDFGYCDMAQVGNKPQMFYNVGSPKYMAPEAYEENIYTQKSDIWALGVILYQLLSGRTCDEGLSMQSYLDMLKSRGVILPQSLHPYFRDLLQNMLCVSQHQRFNISQVIQKLNEAQFHLSQSNIRQSQVQQSVLTNPLSRLASHQVKKSLIKFRNSGSPQPHLSREENMLEFQTQKKLVKCDSAKVMPLFTFHTQKKQDLGLKTLDRSLQHIKVVQKPLININKHTTEYFPSKVVERPVVNLQQNKMGASKNIRFNIANNQASIIGSQYGFQNTPKKNNLQRIDRFTTQPIVKDQNCIRIHIKGNGSKFYIKNICQLGSTPQKPPSHHFTVISPNRGDLSDRRRVRFDNQRKLVGGFTVKDRAIMNTEKVRPETMFYGRIMNPLVVQQTIIKQI